MSDLQLARESLSGHTIALCKSGHILTSDKRGIAPMADYITEGVALQGYSVADLVVGKAAAMLFVKAGIVSVFARTLSVGGKAILEKYGIACDYDVLTDKIINRDGTDLCPMERAVADTEDIEEGCALIASKLAELRAGK